MSLAPGLLMAIPVLAGKVEPKPRSGDMGNLEAMQTAAQPAWTAPLNPFVGADGALIGARLRRRPT